MVSFAVGGLAALALIGGTGLLQQLLLGLSLLLALDGNLALTPGLIRRRRAERQRRGQVIQEGGQDDDQAPETVQLPEDPGQIRERVLREGVVRDSRELLALLPQLEGQERQEAEAMLVHAHAVLERQALPAGPSRAKQAAGSLRASLQALEGTSELKIPAQETLRETPRQGIPPHHPR